MVSIDHGVLFISYWYQTIMVYYSFLIGIKRSWCTIYFSNSIKRSWCTIHFLLGSNDHGVLFISYWYQTIMLYHLFLKWYQTIMVYYSFLIGIKRSCCTIHSLLVSNHHGVLFISYWYQTIMVYYSFLIGIKRSCCTIHSLLVSNDHGVLLISYWYQTIIM